MQLIKKIFYSILILAGIGVMVVLFMFAIMMVFHVSIFGYTYSSVTNTYGTVYDFDKNDFNSIEIETGATNINFYYTENAGQNSVSISLYEDFQGIVKDNIKRYSFSQEPAVNEEGVIKISTVEPEGLIFKNKTTIYLSLPQGKILEKISVKTQSDNVSFGKSDSDFTVKDLTVVSTKKSLNPGVTLGNNLKVTENLSLETYAGRINVDADIGGNVNIKTNIGTILFSKSINGDVTISGDNPNIEFGSVSNSFINKVRKNENYDVSTLKQVNISGDLTIDGVENGGNIKISGTVEGFLYMKSPRMQLWANNINKGMVCEKGSNEIIIFGSLGENNPEKTCELHVGQKLVINNPYSKLEIYADKNGVDIRNAHNNVYVENNNWDTIVGFADDADGKALTVIQNSGNIIADNIQGKAKLWASNGNVSASFSKVIQNNDIKAKNNANITIKDGLTYKLIAKSRQSTNVNIDLGSRQFKDWSTAQSDGDFRQIDVFVPIGVTESENILSVYVENSGSLKIVLN